MSEEKKVKVLQSEYLFQPSVAYGAQESIVLPNGNPVPEYYVLEYPEWVNTIAITRDRKFVFIRQYRHGLGCALMELCAGVCDPEDASPLAAARRELLEETGYGRGTWRELMTVSANPSTHTNLTHCFVAEDVEPRFGAASRSDRRPDRALAFTGRGRDLLLTDRVKQALHAAPLWRYFLPRIACFRISIRFYNNHFPIERSASHSATSPIAYSAIRPAEDFLRFSQSPFAIPSGGVVRIAPFFLFFFFIDRGAVSDTSYAGDPFDSRRYPSYRIGDGVAAFQNVFGTDDLPVFPVVGQLFRNLVFFRSDGRRRVAQRLPVVRLQVPACPAAAPLRPSPSAVPADRI